MNIKVVKNFQNDRCEPINDRLILAISEDSNIKLDRFTGQRIYILDPESNIQTEIAPDIKKFFINTVVYASEDRDYVVFPTAEFTDDKHISIVYYIYRLEDATLKQLHSINADLESFDFTDKIKVFVLDGDNLLIQREKIKCGIEEPQYTLSLFNSGNGSVMDIDIALFNKKGIDNILPISGNKCVIKSGSSKLAEKIRPEKKDELTGEWIGTVPVNQMISELSINMDSRFAEMIEECKSGTTIPYIRVNGIQLVYALFYIEDNKEDIIIVNTQTGARTIRFNSQSVSINDLRHTFVVDGCPYLVTGSDDKNKKIINLNTQKTVMKLESGDDIAFVYDDIVVVSMEKKKLLGSSADYVEVFRFPDIYENPLLSVKGKYVDSLINGDDLIIFTN